MSIIWCGGEDIDFLKGSLPYVGGSTSYFRSDYVRCAVSTTVNTSICKSNTFPGGAVTSCWLSFWTYNGQSMTSDLMLIGLGSSSVLLDNGIFLGLDTTLTSFNRYALFKYYNGTATKLLSEDGFSKNYGLTRFDIQFINLSASTEILVYHNSNLIIDYTGDPRPTGVTELDMVVLRGYNSGGFLFSEIIVADEPTFAMNLVSNYPNAAGDTNDWTGAYTDIDEVTRNDLDVIYTDTVDDDFQCNLSSLPSGTFSVSGHKISIRGIIGGGDIGSIKMGIKSGGTINVDSGQTMGSFWRTHERLMQINPVTSAAFTPAEIDALQINLRSAS